MASEQQDAIAGPSVEGRSMTKRHAVLYRMALSNHVCPYGRRAKELLEETGYEVDDRVLRTRTEVDAFLDENDFETTPQVFIGGERIGGSEELEAYLIKEQSASKNSQGNRDLPRLFASAQRSCFHGTQAVYGNGFRLHGFPVES